MIESVQFKNFKALRDTMLPLGCFTLIVGPNGSGKSTALEGITAFRYGVTRWFHDQVRTIGLAKSERVSLTAQWTDNGKGKYPVEVSWDEGRAVGPVEPQNRCTLSLRATLGRIRLFAFEAQAIAQAVQLVPNVELDWNGGNLAVVLDRLRDQQPEQFEALNRELSRWLPEFDRILFDTPSTGVRAITLRTAKGGHRITANDLSQGTLVALALLTLAYLPEPPSVVCLEEPDHGLHPRLLRDVRDAIYRLAYPESSGEKREPVQVVATTHNPYFLDLFREHPEEIVIAEKEGLEARFTRLSDRTDLAEILGEAHLGEVWYSGVLGGVPSGT
jgi:predicted ATPase